MFGLGHGRGHLGPQRVAVKRGGFFEVERGDGDVVELADHVSITVTRVTGFLPQASWAARRAARRTFSASASASTRLLRRVRSSTATRIASWRGWGMPSIRMAGSAITR